MPAGTSELGKRHCEQTEEEEAEKMMLAAPNLGYPAAFAAESLRKWTGPSMV
jgi:hypothetical protein